MRMRPKLVGLFAAMSLVVLTASVAYAESASVTVSAGTLSVSAANVALSGVTLDGTDKTATSASGANSWTAQDSRGSGAGWHLTIDSTDFTDGGTPLRTIDISVADQEFKIQLTSGNIAVTAGNGAPTTSAATLTAIPTTGIGTVTFASAALNAGMGSYTLNPNFELEVRAETYAVAYTATITVTAVTAP